MKKLREQAFSHINAQLIESDQKHAKGPQIPNPRFIFHNKIPKSGKHHNEKKEYESVQLVTTCGHSEQMIFDVIAKLIQLAVLSFDDRGIGL